MYENSESLCCITGTSVVGQLHFKNKQTYRKRDQICVTRGMGWGEGELDEGSQKLQTSSYKMNKY